MITAALDAGVPAAWVTGDEVYGQDPGLRAALEARGVGLRAGGRLRPPRAGQRRTARLRADDARRRLPAASLAPLSAPGRGQGPALLRLGLGTTAPARRLPLAADPPQPPHR